ncbi:MAG: radical SAM protein, partial [Oscillospiraceae bacterium]
MYEECILCPRHCKADRNKKVGFCGANSNLKVAKAMLHMWEEPPISGENGSGAVFFSNCTLKCCFCQNHKISSGGFGKEITEERLGKIFLSLADKGANNINLVSATPYIPQIISVLDKVKHKINIPIVYNTSGYETVETIKSLEGYV